ncbi:hypothetical protein [Mesorhizobium humile]|uniref:hypothetical protein n=1 Tax=Mesorhizobium humile TaxID=3072313 RepID=UPI002A32D6CD|nr:MULTISPECIES: hypothetical protein [unclassified Mesorhizobium]MDX8459800.1 hypothetical protein [Mesorhizobium sp. VK2D]
MLDSKTIRQKVTEALRAHFGAKWFKPDSTRLVIAGTENRTDFIVEIDIYTERRYGDYDCSAVVVIKWKKFLNTFKEFIIWYNKVYQASAQPLKSFLRASFNGIEGDFSAKSRDAFLVENEEHVNIFIKQCIDDLDGKVGEWIKNWFTWTSALATMDDNENLCGSWRDTAYFCLLERIQGREAACSWAQALDSESWPELQAAQIRYLRSEVCRGT